MDIAHSAGAAHGAIIRRMREPIKAAVYARVSTLDQKKDGESLEMQQAQAVELCAKHGWELLPAYVDAMTGKSDKRPSLKCFEEDLRAGRIKVVICYKVDRLGRSRRKLHEILEYIQQNDIRLISMTQPIDTSTAMGRMILGMMIELAVFEIEQLGERVRDTLLHIAKSGRAPTGSVPYGYRFIPKRIEFDELGREISRIPGRVIIEPTEAQGVRLAFSVYLEQQSIAAAVKALNRSGFRTKRSKPWDVTSVRMMLLNPLYGGERAVRRYPIVGGKQKKRSKVVADIADWMIVQADHEAIVSPEDTAQARMLYVSQRDIPASTRSGKSPWGGLVVCGLCGYRMYAYDPGGGRSKFFRCRSRAGGACDCRMVSMAWLDQDVLQAVARAVDSSALVKGAGTAIKEAVKVESRAADKERQIAAKRRALQRLEVRFEVESIDGETYMSEFKRLTGEIRDITAAETTKPKAVMPAILPGSLITTWEALSDSDGMNELTAIMRSVIQRIEVDHELAIVYLHEYAGVDLPRVLEVERWKAGASPILKSRWAKDHDACRKCRTKSKPHQAKGYCKDCYEPIKRKIRQDAVANGAAWAESHACCVGCGATERRHMGRGLCARCYDRDRRQTKKQDLPT